MQLSLPRPTSRHRPRSFKWHSDWTIDVQRREAVHSSGATFDFIPGWRGHLAPPLGDKCPSGSWKGVLRGGESSLSRGSPQRAVRICQEACLRFGEEAWDACQDCSKHTAIADYYMVTDELWALAHPECFGMLCLACLERRIGRALCPADFTAAPVNTRNHTVVMALLSEQTGHGLADRLLAGKGLAPYMTSYLHHALFDNVIQERLSISDHDCRQALWEMLSFYANPGDVRAVLVAMRDVRFTCTWRVLDDQPLYCLSPPRSSQSQSPSHTRARLP